MTGIMAYNRHLQIHFFPSEIWRMFNYILFRIRMFKVIFSVRVLEELNLTWVADASVKCASPFFVASKANPTNLYKRLWEL